jgi:hypothetical protein
MIKDETDLTILCRRISYYGLLHNEIRGGYVFMLIAKAEIIFFKINENFSIDDGLDASNTLRPAFNFGEDLLFSGTIINDSSFQKYLYEKEYVIKIEFPTIEDEAYEAVKPLIKIGMDLNMQTGSKTIGKAKLLDYTYRN